MASGWFSRQVRCLRWPPFRALRDDTASSQVPSLLPIEAIPQDVCIAAPAEIVCLRVPPKVARPAPPSGSTGIPVLTGVQAMTPINKVPSAYRLDPAKAKKHVDSIRHFRILVMGRANAGKTTILQRVCNTVDEPQVYNREGQRADATVVQGSSKRGYHNIEDELVFQSNPRFVFHDSCGFEAGSEEQFEMMKKFVMDRAKTPRLDKRIHAIWFCIPLTDSHRMVTAAEAKFFNECDTGHVPVIVLPTKADTLELEAVQQVEDYGLSEDDTTRTLELEKEILNNYITKLKGWLNNCKFPPHDYLSLTGMHHKSADCTSLLRCTADALNEQGLQELLISTQQTNLGLCIEYAIMKTLKECMNWKAMKIEPTVLSFILSRWFPYKYDDLFGQGFGLSFGDFLERDDGRQLLLQFGQQRFTFDAQKMDNNLVPPIRHQVQSLSMPILATSMQSSMKYVAEHGIGALLVFEYLYFLLQVRKGKSSLQQDLTLAVKEYQTSGAQANVHKLIEAAFAENGEDVDILCPVLLYIAQENQMSNLLI